jgi:hypothetical protein
MIDPGPLRSCIISRNVEASMRCITLVLVVVAAIAATGQAAAQTALPDTENGRYSITAVPEGALRLDGRTGQVSLCSKRQAGWACQLVPDERNALESEIALLQRQNATLKKELISRGIPLPAGMRAPEPGADRTDEFVLKLPSDAEVDRVMGFFEKVWRRLVDLVQTTQKDRERKG